MCGQGDVEIIHNWKNTHTIDQLMQIVEEKGYSAFTVSDGNPSFGHAALKKFDFVLKRKHCKPISQCCRHPCKIYLYTPQAKVQQPSPIAFGTVGGVCISGWTGYNERLNGDYTADGSSLNNRPVFKHVTTIGVGAGFDWCRLYWAHGAWRIGHVLWVHGENQNAVAYVESDAAHPMEVELNACWREHRGRGAGADYGKEEQHFQDVHGIITAAGSVEPIDSAQQCPWQESADFVARDMAGDALAKVTLGLGQRVEHLYKVIDEAIGQPSQTESWSVHENIDMCGQGDVEIIHNWTDTHTIDQLKTIVEERGYSAFTMSNGKPSFRHAALKKFDFVLEKEHCRPISQCCRHPCRIYIYNGDARRRFQLTLGNVALNQPRSTLSALGVEANSLNQLTLVYKGKPSESQEKLDSAIQQAGWDGDADKVERLLAKGADPNNYDGSKGNRHSALNGAARNGHTICVELLLDAKADLESKESYCGCTPLNQTCYHNRVDIARILIRARANLDARCGFGSPLEMASSRNHSEIRTMIENAKVGRPA